MEAVQPASCRASIFPGIAPPSKILEAFVGRGVVQELAEGLEAVGDGFEFLGLGHGQVGGAVLFQGVDDRLDGQMVRVKGRLVDRVGRFVEHDLGDQAGGDQFEEELPDQGDGDFEFMGNAVFGQVAPAVLEVADQEMDDAHG